MSKKYSLSKEEVANVKFRRSVMDYLTQVVHDDLGQYLYNQVVPRLKLKDVQVEISEDGTTLTVLEKKPDIILPKK